MVRSREYVIVRKEERRKGRGRSTPLEKFHMCIQSLALTHAHGFNICEGFMAVDVWFADSEEV
jgi:hypothetical protein